MSEVLTRPLAASAVRPATAPVPALLEIAGLSVAFKGHVGAMRIVEDVNLTLRRGECVGVVGESGSGKTLSFMAALGLLGRNAEVGGQVLYEGRQILGLGERQLQAIRGRKIGMIFQDPQSALNPVRTIGTQLSEVIRLHLGLGRRAVVERAIELLALVGIPAPRQRLGSYPHEMSGGMCQRVMIAIALASEPELLIADEPTTALDATVQLQVLELLKTIQQRTGMGMVLITHDLGVVAEVCDRVNIMYAGRIVESHAVPEVFDGPLHPYTAALISCLPSIDGQGAAPASIEGEVPVAGNYPVGCAFHPRCSHASQTCGRELPVTAEWVGSGTQVACHHPLRQAARWAN